MKKRELKEKTKFQKWGFFRLFHSAFRNRQSAMGNKGFTLIEIIVLIVLAGIIIPVIVIPFATGIRGSGKPEMATTAMYLAHQKMEELMKFNYCQAPNLTPGTYTLPAPPIAGYTWQWVISYVTNTFAASGSDVGYKMITVTVTDPQGSTYNVYSVVTRF
jgi:type II secretory pathway pseudopilin PulG